MNYTFFVDESGQSGIRKIRSDNSGGASRYMTLGGVLVPNRERETITHELTDLASKFKKPDLHCSKLNHKQIVKFCEVAASFPVLIFGVISLKETLKDYAEEIKHDDKKYYNKCAQYLLERLAFSMKRYSINEGQVSVCFEEGNFDYGKLRSLIGACRKNPLRPATKNLMLINPQSIYSKPKEKEPLLQLADLVAHSLFHCVDDSPSSYGITEPRYIEEMRKRLYCDEGTKKITGYGIYPVHKLSDIKANTKVHKFLEGLASE